MPGAARSHNEVDSVSLRFPRLKFKHDLSTLIAYSGPSGAWHSHEGQLSDTNDMAITQSSIPLGESSYDLLSEASSSSHGGDIDTDDNFGSVASIDEQGSDELESLAGTEVSTESHFTQSESDFEGEPQVTPSYPNLDMASASNSGITVTNNGRRSIASSIEFTEEGSSDIDYVAVTHTIRSFTEAEAADILKTTDTDDVQKRLTVTLRQTMARTGMAVDGSFRVLFVGDRAGKEAIVSKLGSALVAPIAGLQESRIHYSSSRFSVVPISEFGSKRSPTVELIDSFGIELVVDSCTAAKTIKAKGSSDILMLQLNNSMWASSRPSDHGHGFSVDHAAAWKMPQLAVFYITKDDDTEAQKLRLFAKAFLARHKVPSINICDSPVYDLRQESMILNTDSIHVCLESRQGNMSASKVHKRLPVDLATFLSLDSRQMNRNFAFLTRSQLKENRPARHTSKTHYKSMFQEAKDLWRQYGLDFKSLSPEDRKIWLGIFFSGFLLFVTLIGFQVRSSQLGVFNKGGIMSEHVPPSPSPVPLTVTPSTQSKVGVKETGQSRQITMIPTSLMKTTETRALSGPVADFASSLLDPTVGSVNHSDKFDLHLIGDSHMILKAPQRFSQLKKPPGIMVIASRGESVLHASSQKLFDGVWTIQIEREEAYGLVNITIWTKTKPVIRESFEMDLGTPWLKLVKWRKAAAKLSASIQKDFEYANGKLLSAIGEVAADPHGLLVQASTHAKLASKKFRQTSLMIVDGTKNLTLFRASQLQKDFFRKHALLTQDLTVYASDLTTTILRKTEQSYRAIKSFPAVDLWNNLHPVQPQHVWSEARRHIQLMRNGQAYSRIRGGKGKSKSSWKSCTKKAGRKICKKQKCKGKA